MVSWKSSGCNSLTKFLLCRVLSQSSSTDAKSMLRRHNEVFNTFVSISLRTLCESVTKLHSLIICSGEFSLITTPSLSNRVGVHLEVCKRTFSSLELGELLFLGFLNDESQWECDNIGSLGRSDQVIRTLYISGHYTVPFFWPIIEDHEFFILFSREEESRKKLTD